MKQSPDLENFLKTSIQKNVTIERKQQNQTIWHWLLLILFGLLTFGSLTQQLLLIARLGNHLFGVSGFVSTFRFSPIFTFFYN